MLDCLRQAAAAGVTFDDLHDAGVDRQAATNGHWQSLTDEGYLVRLERDRMTLVEDLDAGA